jgi:peptide/nickel transport system ATP-binding protein/oligopeptide transport system ATP-binding protein
MTAAKELLRVEGLKKQFPIKQGWFDKSGKVVHALDGISLHVDRGETLSMVGESGCGKSTAGRVILRLIEPTEGTIRLDGEDITHLSRARLTPHRRKMQIVFQDPYSSINPRMTAGAFVGEPLTVHGIAKGSEWQDRVAELFHRVGLRPDHMKKHPHEFSGGQRQRIGIARALALRPMLIVCDEPVSALDVSIQAQIVNLLMDLQDEYGVSYLFIAHDLAVVEHISDRVAVLYLGRIVELGSRDDLFGDFQHPYTEALLSAVMLPEPARTRPERIILKGGVPSPINPPPGCHFHERCRYAVAECRATAPALREVKPGHWVACHLR